MSIFGSEAWFIQYRRETDERQKFIAENGWAKLPLPEDMMRIGEFLSSPGGSILEVGAGQGYWSVHLAPYITNDWIVTDIDPPRESRWRRDVEKMDAKRAVSRYKPSTLVIIWPECLDAMAYEALREFTAYRGERLMYVGEERGGSNATNSFFTLLYNGWILRETIEFPQFPALHGKIFLYERRPERN